MQEPLEERVADTHPDMQASRTHRAIVRQYERLHKGNAKRTSSGRAWSAVKFNAYKWGVVVPFLYGAVGGDVARMWQERLGVKRKVAVLTNAFATAATDMVWSVSSNEVIDTAFYVKLGITQGWNVYRLVHDEEKNPRIAIGFETLAALAPYTKYFLNKSVGVVDERVDESKRLMEKAVPHAIKDWCSLLQDYYAQQSFRKQQPVVNVALQEGAHEVWNAVKSLYAALPGAHASKNQ